MSGDRAGRARAWVLKVVLLLGATAALFLLARGLGWLSAFQIGYLTR